MRRVYIGLAIVGLALILVTAYFYFRPSEPDRLCSLARNSAMKCPAIVADPVTLRPGGIVREVPDSSDQNATKVDLPSAYLDNETCLIPGAKLEPWSPREEQPFSLPTFNYSFNAISRLGGNVPLPAIQGVEIDTDASGLRIAKISLTFGSARTRLLDENVLLNRIESCEISPRCIERLVQNRYRIINRVIEVEGLSYVFEDEKGARIPLGILLENKSVRAANASFDISQKSATSLNSTSKLVIALTTIDDGTIAKAQPCTQSVVYKPFEGSSRVVIGGGGRPGHIQPRAPMSGRLGQQAGLSASGNEQNEGNIEQTTSTAQASAVVSQVGPQTLTFKSVVQVQGGHYGKRGRLGIGIESGHDTGANAEASMDGRVNVLLRKPAAVLAIKWNGFAAPSGPPSVQQAEIQVVGPNGPISTTPIGSSGEETVRLLGEGYYSVIVRSVSRAEASGHSGRGSVTTNGTVHVSLQPE